MNEETILRIPISAIHVNPDQPRFFFDDEELDALAKSIETVGVIHPPVVRPMEGLEGQYELVSGERRMRACQRLGMEVIPVVVKLGSQQYSAEAALIENIQRVDLSPIEVAKALKRLMDEYDLSQEELAGRVGKKRSTVANYLRLLSLPLVVQDSVSQGEISMGHAKAILSVAGIEEQIGLHKVVVEEMLTVRQVEEYVLKLSQGHRAKPQLSPERDIHLAALAEAFQRALGTKVTIRGDNRGGTIEIEYYGLDDLDRVMELLSVSR